MMLQSLFVTFLLWRIVSTTETAAPIDLETIRQSELTPTALIRVVDPSAAATLQEIATANASSSVSNTSLADLENDNDTQRMQMKYRERKKQERLQSIQTQILQRLRIPRQHNVTSQNISDENRRRMTVIFDRMRQIRSNSNHIENPIRLYAERLQSFYPSCTLPNNTDRNVWENPDVFRIYYDVGFPKASSSTEISIMSAKLRIYKVGDSATDPNFVGWDASSNSLPRYNLLDTLVHSSATNGVSVSVYQYMKPVRMNRKEKKRLIDSCTVPADHHGWVELNVLPALNHWLHHRTKNFGLEIGMEDLFGNRLDPTVYLQNMNCSVENGTQDPPFPNIMELHPEMGENESSLFDNETYPTLDLQTAEVSREETEVQVNDINERMLRKRHVYSHRAHRKPRGRCHREQVYVTFSELGLDDVVISPEGLHWSFCSGSCEASSHDRHHHHYHHHHHSRLFSRYHHHHSHHVRSHNLFGHRTRTKHPNCVVSSYKSLPIIYYNGENEVMETVLVNLIPDQCSCKTT